MVFLVKGSILVCLLCLNTVKSEDGAFYGGSISYKLEEIAGKKIAHIELITGWKLGEGPCGANCSKRDVNKVVNERRSQKEQSSGIQNYFGNFSTDYTDQNRATIERDLNTIVRFNYTEWVIAVSEQAMWEQELMKFSFEMADAAEDINYDGSFWRPLMYGNNFKWHFQTKAVHSVRSDTNRMNNCPQVVIKAFYRVKLNTVSTIRIPMMDPDGDIVRCFMAAFVEGGKLKEAPGVKVQNESGTNVCKVSINADISFGYTDDSWIAIPLTFRDYNTKKIHFGKNDKIPGKFSLSSTSAQFVVQILENLVTPEFVSPTVEGDHIFIAYTGSVWSVDIYAQAPVNTTIYEFIPLGRNREPITVSTIKEEKTRDRVKYATMSWEPSLDDIGQHILCTRVVDSTGVDADELRCFVLEVKADTFNHSSTKHPGKPYFIDIPSVDQFVNCKIAATCLIPLFVKSAAQVKTIQVTESFTDETAIGKVEAVTYSGETVYKAILSFTHFMPGVEKICLSATDINNITSEEVCISSEIEPPDPCLSAPCRNSATCRSNRRTGTFICECLSSQFHGSLCEKQSDPCDPNPCNKDHITQAVGASMTCYCLCKSGFTGKHCEEDIFDCRNDSCDITRGTCRDQVNSVTCDCYSRYSGDNCTTDKCPNAGSGIIACPADGCSPDQCSGNGVCSQGGHCTCRRGFATDSRCSSSVVQYPGVTGVKFVAPTPKDRSQYTCVIASNTIKPCHLSVYLASTGSTPTLNLETTRDLSISTIMGNVNLSRALQGINNVYSTDIVIQGNVKDKNGHYICLTAREGSSEAELCLELKFIIAPQLDPLQKNATIKFVDPTQVEGSRLVSYVNETYTVMLFTTYTSTCENVISTTEGVTVFAPVYDGVSACVTEASFVFSNVGTFDVCFQSAKTSFQKRCFIAEGLTKDSGNPCLSSPCQNNGHCFPNGTSGFQCICQVNYVGQQCQEGPCPIGDCQNDAYCKINDGNKTCICKAGSKGPKCEVQSSQNKPEMTFTDAAKPKLFECVIYQPCSISLLLTGQIGGKPKVSTGYVSPTILLDDIQTVDRHLSGSYQVNIKLKAKKVGIKDVCIQSLDSTGTNKDELCFKVNVITEVSALYGFEDRPHFVYPSLPNNAKVECQENELCHVLYEITPGDGNEKQCVSAKPTGKVEVQTYHLFTSCESCTPGQSNTGNCSLDISMQTNAADVGQHKTFCVALSLTGTSVTGESRCFDVSVVSKAKGEEKKGCQLIECKNGGFCDGHIPKQPVCFCKKGYFGEKCDGGGTSPVTSTHSQSFIGDLSIPSEIKCNVGQTCAIPFEVVTAIGQQPDVSLGYADPRLMPGEPTYTPFGSTNAVNTGTVDINPSEVGTFRLCLQTNVNSKTEEELCVAVKVSDDAEVHIDMSKPHFINPTLPKDSTLLCTIKKPCHLDLYSTKGDDFGVPGKCPKVIETSMSHDTGILIFTPEYQSRSCMSDVTYTAAVEETRTLCFQATLPGKKGETRCYTVKSVADITKEVSSPCTGTTCDNGGKCIADQKLIPVEANCICALGFTGRDCKTVIKNITDLPGIKNLQNLSGINQHFDGNSAVPTDVECDEKNPCCVVVPYHGDINKPPLFGFKDTDLTVTLNTTVTADKSQQNLQFFQTCVKGVPGKKHRMCIQTTADGTTKGINIDEICFEVEFKSGGQDHSSTEPKFTGSLSNGSSVVCQPKSICHIPVITDKKSGSCEQVKECGAGMTGTHVFKTTEVGDKCVTDVAVKTDEDGNADTLCISAGLGGEEREMKVLTKVSNEFGPCQKKHCLNGGRCNSTTETTAVCECTPGYSGGVCEVTPCMGITCYNGGQCIADLTSIPVKANCICSRGFTGNDCKKVVESTNNLPGIRNLPNTTVIKQHFDSNSAIPTHVKCDELNPCCVIVPYQGDSNKPPIFGFKDTDLISTLNATVAADKSQQNLQYFQTCVKSVPGKKHRMCIQTTANGTTEGINIDEICFEVEFKSGGQDHSSTEPKFTSSLSNGSSVLCQPKSICHIPVITDKKSGSCEQVKECGAGMTGTHVFKTTEVGDKCVTDVAIKTRENGNTDTLCISAGLGGEEREMKVLTKVSNEFGPCQKKHCLNGGRCNSTTETTAVCECPPGYSGNLCEAVESTNNLPGVRNLPNTTVIKQHFDGNSAIPTDVKCDEVNPCCVIVPYQGDSNKPPLFGYKDSDLTVTQKTTMTTEKSQHDLQYFQTCVKGVPGKQHRMCIQTTTNGTIQGINVDEICFEVEFKSGGQGHSSTEPKFRGSLSNGSSVLCQTKSICHIPVITDKKSGSCEQVKECGAGMTGIHVFKTTEVGNKCVTDVAIKTSEDGNTDTLCISAGPGGEEREIKVLTKTSNKFGPCQQKHCLNGGRCNSTTETSAVCECPLHYSGVVCETELKTTTTTSTQASTTIETPTATKATTTLTDSTTPAAATTAKTATDASTTPSAATTPITTTTTKASTKPTTATKIKAPTPSSAVTTTDSRTAPSAATIAKAATAPSTATITKATTPSAVKTNKAPATHLAVTTTDSRTALSAATIAKAATAPSTATITKATTPSAVKTNKAPTSPSAVTTTDSRTALSAATIAKAATAPSTATITKATTPSAVKTNKAPTSPSAVTTTDSRTALSAATIAKAATAPSTATITKATTPSAVKTNKAPATHSAVTTTDSRTALSAATIAKAATAPSTATITKATTPSAVKTNKAPATHSAVTTTDSRTALSAATIAKAATAPSTATITKATTPSAVKTNKAPTSPSAVTTTDSRTALSAATIAKAATAPSTATITKATTPSAVKTNKATATHSSYSPTIMKTVPTASSFAKSAGTSNTTDNCDNKKAKQHARSMVATGYASCFCMVKGKKVYVIKKRPVAEKKNMFKAAGFGAGGMVGTLAVGMIVYAVVNAIRKPRSRNKPTPRPKRSSRVHPATLNY
ncbi:uncharacterized protein LOC123563934 isoform X2 [Mercenaria mercenaria]|uniref:uncharacterized protein LOC123563934 isoform X2 n=1 Tax=Mercenaria mercenaria TaxID=6596 RepID=UPI00234F78A6|nr:uncharacterized protein LOC123563934 isoform X2 [Mercenaria mercenaria]